MISNTFCAAPFIHLDIEPSGKCQSCCAILHNYTTTSPQEFWNSEFQKNLRLKMLNGIEPTECQTCFNLERSTGNSMRLQRNSAAFSEKTENQLEARISQAKENGVVHLPPHDFQIQSGNLCNLACKMCRPDNSNAYNKFFEKHFTSTSEIGFNTLLRNDYSGSSFKTLFDWPRTVGINNVMGDFAKTAKSIYLTGGEPSIIEENLIFLKNLSEINPDCFVYFNTNGTNINKQFLDAISKFKHGLIICSVDGVDDIARIQRYPSNWPTIETNIFTLLNWSKNHNDQISIGLGACLTIFNAHSILADLEYLENKFKETKLHITSINIEYCGTTGIVALPKDKAQIIQEQLKNKLDEVGVSHPFYRTAIKELHDAYTTLDDFQDTDQYINETISILERMHPEMDIKKIYEFYL